MATKDEVIRQNKELLAKYPWLTPSNRWSGKLITDCMGEDGEEGYWPGEPLKHPDYDYTYTELDGMPDGWRKAFGEQMCEEINKEWLSWDKKMQEHFRITQIKEKYGGLRFYTNFTTENLDKIIAKYEDLSEKICIECGTPAVWIYTSWITPYCDNCKPPFDILTPIEEYYDTEI